MRQRVLLTFLVLGLCACNAAAKETPMGSSSSETGTGGAGGSDLGGGTGGTAPCTGELQLGRCKVVGTGEDCAGLGEEQEFAPLAPGDSMKMILGPQGSQMFIFAARTTDIDPAVPLVEIDVHNAEEDVVARYRAHVNFAPEPGSETSFTTAGLFVVVEGTAQQLAGQVLRADGIVEDQTGLRRCGSVEFVAGF